MPDCRRASALLIAALCVAGATLSACGRKTQVKPPEMVAPEPIDTLAATNAATGVQLSWRRPAKYADGSRMTDLGAFQVERSSNGAPFMPVATIEVTDRDRLQQARHFRWVDTDAVPGETYQYRVISLTTDGYASRPSNIATIERETPTPAPEPH